MKVVTWIENVFWDTKNASHESTSCYNSLFSLQSVLPITVYGVRHLTKSEISFTKC